jgi:hypothetical protein
MGCADGDGIMTPHQFSMTSAEPARIAGYRSATDAMLHLVLRRKHCARGAVVTALQLKRAGRCEKCVRAA